MKIAPSLLAADFLHLQEEVEKVNASGDILHLDIMDGTLVPNISFGFSVLDQLAPAVKVPMDVHLMVVNPHKWFKKVADDGAYMCSFHLEAAGRRCKEFIDIIHSYGMKAGIAIDPDVPVKKLFPYIGKADFFLIMSVFAGFGGQKFIPESLQRIRTLKDELTRRMDQALIEVDGGVGMSNISELAIAGTDIVVAGSSGFRAQDPGAAIEGLRTCRK